MLWTSTARPEIDSPRVLHVVHGSPALDPNAGGTERYVHALAQASQSPVFTRDRTQQTPLSCNRAGGYPLWTLGLPVPPSAVFEDTYSIHEVSSALSELLVQEPVDLVHFHHFAHLGFNAIQPVLKKNLPFVVTLHDYHLPCARGQLVDRNLKRCHGPTPSRCAPCLGEHLQATARLSRIGRSLPGRAPMQLGRKLLACLPSTGKQETRVAHRIISAKTALEKASYTISPSQNLADRMLNLGWVEPSRIQVVDLPLVSPIEQAAPITSGPVRFLFVGSLIPTKGIEVLIEAFEQSEEGSLIVYGPTPVYDGHPDFGQRILSRIRRCARAQYGGIFDETSRNQVYSEADVLVLPSTWEENSPLVAREAAAAGLRIVASDVGGIHEIAPQARRVPPGDSKALLDSLREEVRIGHARTPSRQWPMDPHLNVLDSLYRASLIPTQPFSAIPR